VKIWDLACNMIRLAGLEPGRDIEVREVGLRPGEKLDEELLYEHESREGTVHAKITRVRGAGIAPATLLAGVRNLTDMALRMDFDAIRAELRALVPEFGQGYEAGTVPRGLGTASVGVDRSQDDAGMVAPARHGPALPQGGSRDLVFQREDTAGQRNVPSVRPGGISTNSGSV
jgi:hypothetical protein